MALEIALKTGFGVTANYINIGSVREDFKGMGTEVTYYGYVSKATRDANDQPIITCKVQYSYDDCPAEADRSTLYELLKQRPEFTDAIDV